MNEFKNYHPIVNFIYFVCVILFACFLMHPVTLVISLLAGFVYNIIPPKKSSIGKSFLTIIFSILIMAVINPLFNHRGVTIIAYFPSGNPLTMESVYYGLLAAIMIVSVILHFSVFNEVITSDKLIYLFGKIIPSLSLIFSMTLRFVPRFTHQLKEIAKAQKCVGRDASKGTIIKRAKSGLKILSILVTWSLENSIETSDSMKARGYGLPGRTAFSIYTFKKRDAIILTSILILSAYIITGSILGATEFVCFPYIKAAPVSLYAISVYAAYFLLFCIPMIIEFAEVIKWKSLKQKI